jgi:hypothetical protein
VRRTRLCELLPSGERGHASESGQGDVGPAHRRVLSLWKHEEVYDPARVTVITDKN